MNCVTTNLFINFTTKRLSQSPRLGGENNKNIIEYQFSQSSVI